MLNPINLNFQNSRRRNEWFMRNSRRLMCVNFRLVPAEACGVIFEIWPKWLNILCSRFSQGESDYFVLKNEKKMGAAFQNVLEVTIIEWSGRNIVSVEYFFFLNYFGLHQPRFLSSCLILLIIFKKVGHRV